MLLCHKNLKTNLQPLNAKAMSHLNPCSPPSVTHEILPLVPLQIAQCCILQCCHLRTYMVEMWWRCRNSFNLREAPRIHLSHSPFSRSCQHTAEFTIWDNICHKMFQSAKEVRGVWKVYLAASVTFCPNVLQFGLTFFY